MVWEFGVGGVVDQKMRQVREREEGGNGVKEIGDELRKEYREILGKKKAERVHVKKLTRYKGPGGKELAAAGLVVKKVKGAGWKRVGNRYGECLR